MVRTLNLYVNDGGPTEDWKWENFIYNIASGAASAYMFGTDPVNSFGVGFAGNYIFTKGVYATKKAMGDLLSKDDQ